MSTLYQQHLTLVGHNVISLNERNYSETIEIKQNDSESESVLAN